MAISAADHGALDEPPGASACSVVIDGDSRRSLTAGSVPSPDLDRSRSDPRGAPAPSSTRRPARNCCGNKRSTFWCAGRARPSRQPRGRLRDCISGSRRTTDERLFGMGQRTHGRLNLKGLGLDLIQRNGEVNIPFVLSNRGYGLLWNLPAVGRVEFGV